MPEYAHFVSVARFAKLVGLSERTCWNLIRTQAIPVHRIGRRTLVKAEEGFEAIEKLAEDEASAQER
jgi:hypothetical protein